ALIQASRPSWECWRSSLKLFSRSEVRASRALREVWVSEASPARSSLASAFSSERRRTQASAASASAATPSNRPKEPVTPPRGVAVRGGSRRSGAALIFPPVLALLPAVGLPPVDDGVGEHRVGGFTGDHRAAAGTERRGELDHTDTGYHQLRRLEVGCEARAQHALQVQERVAA